MPAALTPAVETMLESMRKAVPALDEARLRKAFLYAQHAYGESMYELMEGITLLEHATKTAEHLAEFCPDEDAIIACVLQHVLRMPDHPLDAIAKEFGRGVRDMVSRIHLLSHLSTSDWRKSIDDMKIMLVSVSDDIRILLIALTITSYATSHIASVKPKYRSRLCRQSLQLFAPVAARLGIYAIKYRLERDAFRECYPTDAEHIAGQLSSLQEEHGSFLEKTVATIKKFLAGEGIHADLMAREKQPYSIFRKMHTKSVTGLQKITDLFAIRVIVPTVPDCYQTLGLLHRIGTPISQRFKDYISFPKPNGYQSLHTSLIGLPNAPKNVIIEVQIRTLEMHREAEYGVAAHWLYKESDKGTNVLRSASHLHMSDVLLKQQSVGSVVETGSKAESRLVNDIYVLTPRGDIIELPEGATPLDFAFMLHTDLGLKFKSARVNGHIVPLAHKLENGDVVEIQTHKHPRPSLQWTQELVTPSARSKLKNYFFSQNRSQFLEKGRENVNAELMTRGLPVLDNDYTTIGTFDGKSLSVRQREDLLVKIGMGSIRTSSILRHLPMSVPRKQNARATKTAKKQTVSKQQKTKGELVLFEDKSLQMPYRFAKCCSVHTASPRPDAILGIVTRAGIVSVHREGCGMTKAANSERKVKMRWA